MTDIDLLAERLKLDSAIPADCSDGELALADFSKRDVLIGTIRSDAQFDHKKTDKRYGRRDTSLLPYVVY